MNLELIMKLIRLANNNPNENEANSAARKACELLKDYRFDTAIIINQPIDTTIDPETAERARRMQEQFIKREQKRAQDIMDELFGRKK